MEIKGLKFLDQDTLNATLQSSPNNNSSNSFNSHWLIIYSDTKIFLYDYILESTRAITPSDLE